jgi:hypothetical protein
MKYLSNHITERNLRQVENPANFMQPLAIFGNLQAKILIRGWNLLVRLNKAVARESYM